MSTKYQPIKIGAANYGIVTPDGPLLPSPYRYSTLALAREATYQLNDELADERANFKAEIARIVADRNRSK